MAKRRPPILKNQPLADSPERQALLDRYLADVRPLKLAYQEAEKAALTAPNLPPITLALLLADLDLEIALIEDAITRNPRLEFTPYLPLQLQRSKRLRAWIAAGGSPSRQELSRRFTTLAVFSGGDS